MVEYSNKSTDLIGNGGYVKIKKKRWFWRRKRSCHRSLVRTKIIKGGILLGPVISNRNSTYHPLNHLWANNHISRTLLQEICIKRQRTIPRKTHHSLSGRAEKIQKIYNPYDIQDNIQKWYSSSKIFLPSQAPKRIQHHQELRVIHPMQLWYCVQRQNMPSIKNKAKRISKKPYVEMKSKIGYSWTCMENKGETILPLLDESKITEREEYWKIRCLKEAAQMLDYNDMLSKQSIEMNTIWEPIIKKAG